MEKVRSFKKVNRSYHSTPDGWRLATFEEAKNGLEGNMVQQHLKEWERARLLDGWISGSGYGYEIKNEFRGCMGYMLLVEIQTSAENESGTPYADVDLSELGKEVALFLCVDDWNLEVICWLFNSWSKSDTMMKLSDVRGGNLPFVNAQEFKKMNEDIGRLARRLGDEEVQAREKGRMTKYSGTDSVEEVLSGMMQIVTEEEKISGYRMRDFSGFCGNKFYLPGFAQTGDVAEVFWSFVCETFADFIVEDFSVWRLETIRCMKTKGTSKKNWVEATCNLEWLSYYRSDIVHEPLKHGCVANCVGLFLSDAEYEAGGDPHRFRELISHNAKWRCHDKTGHYGVLSKLLSAMIIYEKWGTVEDVEMLLKCGAEPAGCYTIRGRVKKTNLHNVAEFNDKDKGEKFARCLLGGCDEESRTRFVNAVNENGMTALHIACQRGFASLSELLVQSNASVNAQDNEGMTPLHYALEGEGADEVINVLMKSPQAPESVNLRDKKGYTPLDVAIDKKDFSIIAKLLPMSKETDRYLNKVDDQERVLLRFSLLVGAPDTFEELYEKDIKLPAGDFDDDGKSALHLAAMKDDDESARKLILSKINPGTNPQQVVQMVAECDRRKRTLLHEAALNGHEMLCKILLHINPNLLYMKDRDRRNPLYDLAKGKYKGTALTKKWLNAWEKKGMHMQDMIDRSGLTPLHVAVSQGNVEFVKMLLSYTSFTEKYLSRGDFFGQTALHKAAKRGDIDIMIVLLNKGAHPLRERDCDGRTALHYAVQAETADKQKLAQALFSYCKSEKEKSLLLWASAAGLGTADKNLSNNDPLRKFLLQKFSEFEVKKDNNLLRMAASVGDLEMTKELIARGYQKGEILNADWKSDPNGRDKATRVSQQLETLEDQGNDRPAILDTLGRVDYAQGIAALLLNPYTRPPIAVGVTGTWGMGKSSLMFQTEQILLASAAQMALLESSKLPSTALELPDIKSYKLTRKGEKRCKKIYNQIMCEESVNRNSNKNEIQKELEDFLNNKYDESKYRKVFKSLAAMDSSDMFEPNDPRPKASQSGEENMLEKNAFRPNADQSAEKNVSAVLTVQYNAWKYRNDTEALAGMAVEITKELEGVMTQAQWLSTCCRNTWRKNKYNLWIEIFFPSILALVLVSSLTWIIWVVFDSEKLKEWGKTKYAWPPAAIVVTVWTVTNSVMGVLKPVSSQLMQYISFPDHSDKLGYQETVISDITFLKEEIGKNAYRLFIFFDWIFTIFTVLWSLITQSCLWATSLFFHHKSVENSICVPKVSPASGSNLRIIVFVDDLDRCQESVILQVLSAINLVLAECEINVVMGMDKRLIQRAIMKQYGDGKKTSQELADMYLQKIIQLPLDLPDPSDEESRRFLKAQLGVYEHREEAPAESGTEESVNEHREEAPAPRSPSNEESDDGNSCTRGEKREAEEQITEAQFIDISEMGCPGLSVPNQPTDDRRSSRGDSEKKCLRLLKFPVKNIVCDFIGRHRVVWSASMQTGHSNLPETTEPTEAGEEYANEDALSQTGIKKKSRSSIHIREMLFVRYSKGEEDAFFYFQRLATDSRKLPREWKRLLNYHRLVWYIFSVSEEAKILAGWQVQLMAWVFVCWEWQENMNLVIQKWKEIKWNEIKDLKTSESNEPSLLMIVEHLIEEHERENRKNIRENENMEKDTSQNLVKDINKLDALEKSVDELKKEMNKLKEPVSDELKEEMKELIKQVSDELKEEMRELKKQMFDVSREMKKDINDIREQMPKKKNGKNQQNMENEKVKLHNLANWRRMKSTLERYNVSMDGIQAFQRFRFYCTAGFLPRPSSREQ